MARIWLVSQSKRWFDKENRSPLVLLTICGRLSPGVNSLFAYIPMTPNVQHDRACQQEAASNHCTFVSLNGRKCDENLPSSLFGSLQRFQFYLLFPVAYLGATFAVF